MSTDRQTTSPDDHEQSSLEAVLAVARKALARGDAGWTCEYRQFVRLCRDCEALGIAPNTMSITVALRGAFSELTVQDLSRKADESYAGLGLGQTLYVAKWKSQRLGRVCYLKFAQNAERIEIEIFTFHEDTPKGQRR